ncbi:uncharacterized protein LOC120259978 [Dioscorea cayenensis subsp. rotundata]|uniref:Uncharacterized protein LOC120259978 n=1 Tax=Dioscorea cayennensis subsp. rotundata TaxID=55577 RepID=A0AB40B7W9_DIOCR|nr:uncharacterized protein LOC120259978 [Dioscorea cayenensis subsp. rotundata]
MFQTLHINVPFIVALTQMPCYAKFLKELLTNKRKLEEVSTVTLSEKCSAIISNKIPKKEKYPGGLIIPCTIGGMLEGKALADLGANVLVNVDRFIFLADFVILDLNDNAKIPLILEHPFLATSQALIDVMDGRMVLRVGDEEVVFKLKDAMSHSMDGDDMWYALDIIDDCVLDFMQDTWMKDNLTELLDDEEPPDGFVELHP